MIPPKLTWELSANSIVTVSGFLLTWGVAAIAGSMAYATFKSEIAAKSQEIERRVIVLEGRAEAADGALRQAQISSAASNAEMVALRRDLGDIKSELREVIRLLRQDNGVRP
jgi:chromosome segregation ATPase